MIEDGMDHALSSVGEDHALISVGVQRGLVKREEGHDLISAGNQRGSYFKQLHTYFMLHGIIITDQKKIRCVGIVVSIPS